MLPAAFRYHCLRRWPFVSASRLSWRAVSTRTLRVAKLVSTHPRTYQHISQQILRFYSGTPVPADDTSKPPQGAEQVEAVAALADFVDKASAITPPDDAGRLIISYALIYGIIKFLARHGEGSEAYLMVFMNAEAPQESSLDWARLTVRRATRLVVSTVSGVHPTSPLREAHPQIFDLFSALEVLFMANDLKPQLWRDFWGRAQLILLEMAAQLDEAGFGAETD